MWRLVLAVLSSAGFVFGCSCRWLTECELAGQPVIFLGKVIAGGVASVREDPWHTDAGSVRFEVVESFRGLEAGRRFVQIRTQATRGMCSPNPYRPGRTYLVTTLIDGGCFGGRDVVDVPDTIAYLRRHFQNPQASLVASVRGQVAAAELLDPSYFGYLVAMGEAKPLSGVQVWARAEGRTYSTTTDAGGRYELPLPGPGQYELGAEGMFYKPHNTSVTIERAGSCAVKNIGLESRSIIHGHLRDRWGQPLALGQVGLMALDGSAGSRSTYPDKKTGAFVFKNVPLGRYRLAFNPEGPSTETPFETSYHAGGVIDVDRGTLTLVAKDVVVPAGPPVAFRTVRVTARFADGQPMPAADVRIEGDPAWRRRGYISKDRREAVFQVPINRRFRIKVTDGYGRPLNKTYESTHGAGATPVQQDFVIDVP